MKRLSIIIFLAILPVILIWLPFFMRLEEFWHVPLPIGGMQTVMSNYDGPLYIAVSKSFYDLKYLSEHFSFQLPVEYYAAHFPLFPALIYVIAFAVGSPWGMLIATLFGSIISLYFFFKLIREYVSENDALWITAVFAIFPARWLIVRSVGSPEPLFVGAIIASVYYFRKKNYWLAGIWGAIAQLTKSPGILLFIAYVITIYLPKLKTGKLLSLKPLPILLIPLALHMIFWGYSIQFGNYLAYFNSGDNIHLFFPPFQIFNYSQPWVETHWLEEVIFIYLAGILGLLKLIKLKDKSMAWFVGIFFTTILFVSHRDILRYSLPIIPFLFIAFRETLIKREFKIAMVIIIIPIYLYSLAFISNNIMPISNWTPFL